MSSEKCTPLTYLYGICYSTLLLDVFFYCIPTCMLNYGFTKYFTCNILSRLSFVMKRLSLLRAWGIWREFAYHWSLAKHTKRRQIIQDYGWKFATVSPTAREPSFFFTKYEIFQKRIRLHRKMKNYVSTFLVQKDIRDRDRWQVLFTSA